MAYTTINKSSLHFNTKTYTGTGSSNAITGVGFQPDWIWIKNRSSSSNHHLVDAVRGITKELRSNLTNTEATDDQLITAIGNDGFTVGTSGSGNPNNENVVAWNWKANGQGSSNTDGGINTTYTSANTTSGFSIVTWTGTGSASSIGHGLGVKPSMVILKSRSNTYGWYTWHKGLSSEMNKYLRLDGNGSVATDTSAFGSTAPTTTVFPIGTGNSGTNVSGHTYVAYCFAEKTGFSKFGSYRGNGSTDGTFVYTGFKPAFVMTKYASGGGTGSWHMYDNKRKGYNTENDYVQANTTSTENSDTDQVDLLSNGFKWRANGSETNTSGGVFIYLTFAEAPLVGTNNVAANAK